MNCPMCDSDNTAVLDTRTVDRATRRSRKCGRCHHKFTTLELPSEGRDRRLELALLAAVDNLKNAKIEHAQNMQRVENRMRHLEGEIVELADLVRNALPYLIKNEEAE